MQPTSGSDPWRMNWAEAGPEGGPCDGGGGGGGGIWDEEEEEEEG